MQAVNVRVMCCVPMVIGSCRKPILDQFDEMEELHARCAYLTKYIPRTKLCVIKFLQVERRFMYIFFLQVARAFQP